MAEQQAVPSFIEATAEARQEVLALTEREQEWYADRPTFQTSQDMHDAYIRGNSDLVHIGVDQNIAPIYRLRNPERTLDFPPYLLANSAESLQTYGRMWRSEIEAQGIDDPRFRIAVTSLGRSQEAQDIIVADTSKLASPISTHPKAAPYDIDASGYFILDPGRGLLGVAHPDREAKRVATIAHQVSSGDSHPHDMERSEEPFAPELTEALIVVAKRLHEIGVVNTIVEYAGTSNQCIHICPDPKFTAWSKLP